MSTLCSIANACHQGTNPSRVCLMSAKRKRSYDVAMKLQAVDVAETATSKEAAARQFGVSLYGAGASREK